MARTSVYDVTAVGDPALSWNYDLFLPAIPGTAETRQLTWRCMSTALPGSEVDRVDVQLHGVQLVYMGRRNWSHSFNSTFLEAIDWATRDAFVAWMEAGRSWVRNAGTESTTYKVNGQLVVYDDIPNVVKTVQVVGMWPQAIADVPLDGSQGGGHVSLEITWAYDYTIDL
ncbi:tail tube protein [Ralstonia phage phiRSL1]|uniref:Tail tube protein n=1 Tax=Ralstonia phage phiRSL1 TaxID=1980924 RepID=B2ZY00_9CAUD|nr:tail tube protein [Ralstonia phage phiRSL1]BAG41587.1 tail tube protein [Ralstonia phage phiRSL1]